MLTAHVSHPIRRTAGALGQADTEPQITKTTIVVGIGSFLLGALWGWFSSQA